MLFPLLVVTCLASPDPMATGTAEPIVMTQLQEPTTKPAPKQSPKQTPPPKPPAASRTKPNPGGSGAARPPAPRGNSGGAPRATGEPKLKRRGS